MAMGTSAGNDSAFENLVDKFSQVEKDENKNIDKVNEDYRLDLEKKFSTKEEASAFPYKEGTLIQVGGEDFEVLGIDQNHLQVIHLINRDKKQILKQDVGGIMDWVSEDWEEGEYDVSGVYSWEIDGEYTHGNKGQLSITFGGIEGAKVGADATYDGTVDELFSEFILATPGEELAGGKVDSVLVDFGGEAEEVEKRFHELASEQDLALAESKVVFSLDKGNGKGVKEEVVADARIPEEDTPSEDYGTVADVVKRRVARLKRQKKDFEEDQQRKIRGLIDQFGADLVYRYLDVEESIVNKEEVVEEE